MTDYVCPRCGRGIRDEDVATVHGTTENGTRYVATIVHRGCLRFNEAPTPGSPRVRARVVEAIPRRGPNAAIGKTRNVWVWDDTRGWRVISAFVAFTESDDPAGG